MIQETIGPGSAPGAIEGPTILVRDCADSAVNRVATRPAKPKPQSVAVKLQACLEIDDETKERLNCYDAIFPPKPNPKAPAAKAVTDCRFAKEEDERLKCFNGFAEKIPKLPK